MKHRDVVNKIADKLSWIFSEYKGLPDLGYYLGVRWDWVGPLKMHYTNPYTGNVSYVSSIPRLSSVLDAVKNRNTIFTNVMPKLSDRLGFLKNLALSIDKYAKELAASISITTGKPIREAEYEVDSSIELLENSYALLETYGKHRRAVTGNTLIINNPSNGASLIMPSYTSPILTTVFGVIHSIALGSNLTILKPPSKAPLPSTLLAGILVENEFRNIIVTAPIPGPVILDILNNSMLISNVFAAGSTSTIENVSRRAPGLYKVLWGSDLSTAVICDESGLERAARTILESRLSGCGDLCLNTHIVLTTEHLLGMVEEKLASLASSENPGDPLDHTTTLGPLIEEVRGGFVESLVDDALSRGARLLHGRRLRATLYQPYILGNVKKTSKMLWQRTIVPVLGIVPVKSCSEAISMAESMPYVKAILFYSEKPHRFLEKLKTSKINIIHINTFEVNRISYYEECTNMYTSPLIDSSASNRVFRNIIVGEEEREPETYR